jgi:hypothetical protein
MGHPKHPLFPTTIEEQISDLHTKVNYLTENATRFGIPASELTKLSGLVANVDAAHAKMLDKDTRTKLDTANQTEAILLAQAEARKIIEYYVVGNPETTPVDYEALRIPVPGHHTPLPSPTHAPGLGHITSEDLGVTVPFHDAQHNIKGKPDGVYAIEGYYKLGGTPPADISELSEKATATASPMHLQFEFADEFKILYLAFRWIGTRGDYGPWTDIHKIAIAR